MGGGRGGRWACTGEAGSASSPKRPQPAERSKHHGHPSSPWASRSSLSPPSSCPLPQKPQPGVAVVLGAAALNVLPLLLAAGGALLPRYLGLLGLAMALVQYFAMKHVRGIGAKII